MICTRFKRNRSLIPWILGFLIILVSISSRGSDVAVDYYQSGDYAEARLGWNKQSDLGDFKATFNLGLLYHQGLGVPAEPDRAANYFYLSAIKGYAPAQYMYARFHESGQTSDSSPATARFWMNNAARQGHANAAFRLGKYLIEGYGGHKNTQAGIGWLRKAERSKVIQAKNYLNEFDGRLPGAVSDDDGQITAKLKEGRGTLKQRKEYFEGQKSFISQNYQKAVLIWAPLAEQGMAKAQYGLAFLLESGWGVVQDYGEAAYWYQKSAQKGHRKAQFNLGKLYIEGRGVEENSAIGHYWIQSAADLGEVRAIKYIRGL